ETYGTTWETVDGPYVFAIAGSASATLRALEVGPNVAQAGDTWTATMSVANLTGFTNTVEDADLGALEETNPDFRRRRVLELFARGNGPTATISAVVSKLKEVRSVRTHHNPRTQPVDSDGIPWKATNTVVDLFV